MYYKFFKNYYFTRITIQIRTSYSDPDPINNLSGPQHWCTPPHWIDTTSLNFSSRLEDEGVQEQGRAEGEAHHVAFRPVLCRTEGRPRAHGDQPGLH